MDNDKARGYRKSALSFSSYLHEELFHYLLETGNLPKARRLTRGLREAFGQDSRWSRFREAMEARLVDAGIGGSLDEFLG